MVINPIKHIIWRKMHRQIQKRFPAVHKIKDTGKYKKIMGVEI